jgi:hypothetical protein
VMDLAIIMLVAAIMIVIAFKLKQPMVIGYFRRHDYWTLYAAISFG